MINRKDLIVGKGDFMMSLSKLTGKKIVDVTFYLANENELIMKVCSVIFEDGSEMGFEGEHDLPYLTIYTRWPIPNTDDETLQAIYEQSDDYKDTLDEEQP